MRTSFRMVGAFLIALILLLVALFWAWIPTDVDNLNRQAAQLGSQGKYAEANKIAEEALVLAERALGPDHLSTIKSINTQAELYRAQGRYGEAEPLHKRGLASAERTVGPDHPATLMILSNLASLYKTQARYGEAEPLFERALAGYQRTLGPDHPATHIALSNQAGLYADQGRHSEAEPLLRRVLDGAERLYGPEHPSTFTAVANLAVLYDRQGRYGEAEPLYKRTLSGRERVLGPEHPHTLISVNNLAQLYQAQGRYGEAEPLLRRALADRERILGPEHPQTLVSSSNLAVVYQAQERYSEAEPLMARVLAVSERTFGPDHPDTLSSVNNLAALYQAQGRYSDAEPLMMRALSGYERTLGPEHPEALIGVDNLADLYFAQGDWVRAAAFWHKGLMRRAQRSLRGMEDIGKIVTGRKRGEADLLRFQFFGLVKSTYRRDAAQMSNATTAHEMFRMAQWGLSSEAAQSLAQMAARGAKGEPGLSELVRERQDRVAEWQKRELMRNAALAQETGERSSQAEAKNNASMAAIDMRIAEIDKRLALEFPDYASLASPTPLSVEDVQSQLGGDEALVLLVETPEWKPTPEETFIWVVTKTQVRWVRSDVGRTELTKDVLALRCGLDATAWERLRCEDLTGRSTPDRLLPFDHVAAHRLYKALFGQVEDIIKGKHLLIVPSGPLTLLPFQVLVTAPPANAEHKTAQWLIRKHAVTILPAVSSLKALRRGGRPSAAPKVLIGFGNPQLDGPDRTYAKSAQLARDKQKCPQTLWQRTVSLLGLRGGGVRPIETRGGVANVALIRQLAPLHETADELCTVARDIGADPAEIRLGTRATEREVKQLSVSGELAKFRIVHFATHGAMAGDLSTGSEPGLILTPPDVASEEDDGYLTASEIAALKLDADWVILSACNTAAGDTTSAEALSGLARAFIYAQARALLVSHWSVDSQATVKLVISATRAMARDKTVGRAEALRRAMIALIDRGDPHEAHPTYWAPFIVVGEGGR